VNQDVVKKEMERLHKHAIIAYFVGGRQPNAALQQWTAALQTQLGEWVGLGRELGHGFFQVITRKHEVTQKLLTLTPHRSRWGTCILQTWATGFNPCHPTRLKVPTWVTLRGIPGEFLGEADKIAGGLGDLLASDRRNAHTAEQRFCVALQAGQGWRTQLRITNHTTQEQAIITVDYCNLPIRCRICMSTDHLAKDCQGAMKAQPRPEAKPTDGREQNLPPAPAEWKKPDYSRRQRGIVEQRRRLLRFRSPKAKECIWYRQRRG